jgi:preprotein translocase subunit Sec61beta
MSRDNKVSMPSSTAGITRYFDDYKSKIEFKPGHIIILICVIIILEIVLKVYGANFFGVMK